MWINPPEPKQITPTAHPIIRITATRYKRLPIVFSLNVLEMYAGREELYCGNSDHNPQK
jgi:hypothetical protein